MTLPPLPYVSDHALLRYLERAHGLDVEQHRQHVAELVARGVRAGASGVRVEGCRFILNGNRVTTVLDQSMTFTYATKAEVVDV